MRVRRPFLIAALTVSLASCGAWFVLNRGPDADRRGRPHSPGRSENSARSTPVASSSSRVLTNAATGKNEGAPVAPPTVVSLPEPTPYSRQLVGTLCRLDQAGIPRSPEQVAEWKQNFQQLIAQRPRAVGAIREFLQKNVD